jgi:hypothetical protein
LLTRRDGREANTSIAAVALLVAADAVLAGHMGYACNARFGSYSNNALEWIDGADLDYINWSVWGSNRDFVGKRQDIDGTITYSQWVPGGSWHRTTTVDGYDRYLRTGIQRAGYTGADYEMRDYSHAGC